MLRRLVPLFLVMLVTVTACDSANELNFDTSVPDDLRLLATETWNDFLDAIPAQQSCVAAPTLTAAWELDSRGEYRPTTATVVVRVPGTPATLRSELLHEFGHHLEFTCPEHEGLRSAFLAAQGLPEDSAWFEGDTWETTPSEQYAEAIVEVVAGRRSHRGGIVLNAEAIAVVRRWGLGS